MPETIMQFFDIDHVITSIGTVVVILAMTFPVWKKGIYNYLYLKRDPDLRKDRRNGGSRKTDNRSIVADVTRSVNESIAIHFKGDVARIEKNQEKGMKAMEDGFEKVNQSFSRVHLRLNSLGKEFVPREEVDARFETVDAKLKAANLKE